MILLKTIAAHAMMLISLRRLSLFPLLLLLSAAPALAEDWVIVKVSGEAWISNPNAPVARATTGMTVSDGATFSTSHNARAQLERGAESILVSPNTVISPQSYTFFGTSTTIQQQVGRIELEVEKRNVKHFSVKTPLLAAVVKGTRFTVSVSPNRADVQVTRGLVEVSDLKTGASADVGPGQKAIVGGPEGRGLQVTGASDVPDSRKGRAQRIEDEDSGEKSQSGNKTGSGNTPNGSGSSGGAAPGNSGSGGKGSSGSGASGSNAGGNGNGGGKGADNGGGKGADNGNGSAGGSNSGGGNGNAGGSNAGSNGKGNGGAGSGNAGGSGGGKGSDNGNGGGKSDTGGSGNGRGGGSDGKAKR